MDRKQLVDNIFRKKSFLCVGLDTDLKKIPNHLLNDPDPIFAFNKAIIDATAPHCVAYKPNLAFYECYGMMGWKALEKQSSTSEPTTPTNSSSPTPSAATSETPQPCMPDASSKKWTSTR